LSHFVGGAQATGCQLHAPLPSAETGQIVPEHRVGSIVRTFVHHKTPKSRPRRVRPTFRSVCSTVLCLVEIRLHPGLVVRTFARQGAVHIRICLIFGSSRGTGWHRVQPGEVGCHRGGVVDSCSDRSGRARERQRECPAHKSDDYELAAAPRLCDGLGGRRAVALLLRQAGLRVSRGGRHSSCMRWATLRGYDVDPADLPPDSSSTGSARSALNVRRGVVVPARSPWRERAAARDPATRRRAREFTHGRASLLPLKASLHTQLIHPGAGRHSRRCFLTRRLFCRAS